MPNAPVPPYHQQITPNRRSHKSLVMIPLAASPETRLAETFNATIHNNRFLGQESVIKPVEIFSKNDTFNIFSCPSKFKSKILQNIKKNMTRNTLKKGSNFMEYQETIDNSKLVLLILLFNIILKKKLNNVNDVKIN